MEQITFEQLPAAVTRLALEVSELKKLLINQCGQTHTEAPDQLLTVHQAADFLSLAAPTIYNMVQRKELPVCKRAGRLYFSKAELLEYVKAGRKKSNADIEAEAASYIASTKKRG